MNPITKVKALSLMQYHLVQQAHWQRKVEAREKENMRVARQMRDQGRWRSRGFEDTPDDYFMKRVCQDDFWLKKFEDTRDHHQKQAQMWAAAARALED